MTEESVKAELQGSLDFVVGMLVFGAFVFAVLFNLCVLAVANDILIKQAYLVLSHPESVTVGEMNTALETLDQLLLEDVRDGGRPVLCEEDEALLSLAPRLDERGRIRLTQLMERKTGEKEGWKALYLRELPSARSPFRMPFLELSLLYYSWIIEVATIIFLSQSLRKPHVQMALYRAVKLKRYFIPAVTALLVVPSWHFATLVAPRTAGAAVGLGILLACLVAAFLMHKSARLTLTPSKMNEVGFHLLISSLFIQLLTAMGDPDVVYTVFSAHKMRPLKYLSWFILICYPFMLLEKCYRLSRDQTACDPASSDPDLKLEE